MNNFGLSKSLTEAPFTNGTSINDIGSHKIYCKHTVSLVYGIEI